MRIQASLIRLTLRLIPAPLIMLVANLILRGIARVNTFQFTLEPRRLEVSTRLEGEAEDIHVIFENFGLIRMGEQDCFMLQSAMTNKVWLKNLLSHVIQKPWPLPNLPELAPYRPLLSELLTIPSTPATSKTPSSASPKWDKRSSVAEQTGTP